MSAELEIRVPISATESFLRRIHFMAASLERLGTALPRWRLSVFVGHDAEPLELERTHPWTRRYPIDWYWSDPEAYRKQGYWANSLDCIRREVSTRWVMFVDGDVIFVKAFTELFGLVAEQHSIAGVIAHWAPVPDEEAVPMWRRLFREYGLGEPSWDYQHSGWGYVRSSAHGRYTPAYYNYGVILGRAEEMAILSRQLPTTLDFLATRSEPFFSYQIGTTLLMHRHGIKATPLPVRYNFPNDPGFDEMYAEDLADIRILHYLRTGVVDRDLDFSTLARVRGIIERDDLAGSNRVLQESIASLFDRIAGEE